MGLFDLAMQAADRQACIDLVAKIRSIEGEEGTRWRFALAALKLDAYRRGSSGASAKEDLAEAREVAAKIVELRPGWWGGPSLKGQIAELNGFTDEAIEQYSQAITLGDLQPATVNRLLGILYQHPSEQADQINKVVSMLREQGYSVDKVTIVNAAEAVAKGDPSRGIALARQVLPESSGNSSDHLTMGRLYLAAGRPAEAGTEFRRAVELGPGDPQCWLAYVQFLATDAKQNDKARTVIAAAVKQLPHGQSSLFTLARCLMIVGDAKQAEALVEKAQADYPNDPEALQNRVLFYFRQRRMSQAGHSLDVFEKLPNLLPDAKTWASRIRQSLLLSTGRPADYEKALRLCEELLKRDPASRVDLRMKVSTLAARPSRRQEAIRLLEDMVAKPSVPTVEDQFYLAKLYSVENMPEKYQQEILKIVGPGKSNPPAALTHYINYLLGRNRLDEAESCIAMLRQKDAEGSTTLDLQAQLLGLRKQRPQLLALLGDRGRKFPEQIGWVAELLARHGFAGEAEQAYKDFIARRPDLPERVLPLANFYAKTGRTSEAMALLNHALKTLPKERVARAALAVLDSPAANASQRLQARSWVEAVAAEQPDLLLKGRVASMALEDGYHDEAISMLRKIVAANPENASALNNLAWILGLVDPPQTEEALKLIDRAIDLNGSDPSLLDTRAVILIRAGRWRRRWRTSGRRPRSRRRVRPCLSPLPFTSLGPTRGKARPGRPARRSSRQRSSATDWKPPIAWNVPSSPSCTRIWVLMRLLVPPPESDTPGESFRGYSRREFRSAERKRPLGGTCKNESRSFGKQSFRRGRGVSLVLCNPANSVRLPQAAFEGGPV